MPSWNIHEKWCAKILPKILKDLNLEPLPVDVYVACRNVDRAIDLYKHDVYDDTTLLYLCHEAGYTLEYDGKKINCRTTSIEELKKIYESTSKIVFNIPDYAIVGALIHHILDRFEEKILRSKDGANPNKAVELLNDVGKMDRVSWLGLILSTTRVDVEKPELLFAKIIFKIKDELSKNISELYNDIVADLRRKGLEPGSKVRTNLSLDVKTLMALLKRYCERNNYGLVLRINGIYLPLLTAAKKIYSELSKGSEVTIEFIREGGHVAEITRINNLETLLSKLEGS